MLQFTDNIVATIILSLAAILIAGFLMTRITKKFKLPNVTGYILAGVLIGPYVLNLVPQSVIRGMDFVTDIALAFIAFGVGKYFKIAKLKKSGKRVVIITVFEALVAAVFVTLFMYFVFHLPLSFCLLLGAIGSATAPASTIMTIHQYKAKGRFVNTLLQVVALDDAVALIAFSICASIAQAMVSGGSLNFQVVVLPIILNIISVILGMLGGFLLNKIITERRSADHRLVMVIAIILTLTGFCTIFNISPLLSCMMLGATYINVSNNKSLFKQVNRFTPPVLLCFFVLSGMKLNLPSLMTAGIIGLAFFAVRIVGKYIGAWLGAKITHSSKPIQKYLGLALIPSAGVSIGLAALGARILPEELGTLLSTIILSAGVLYEMVGPACAKASLFLSGSIKTGEKGKGKKGKKKKSKGKKTTSAETGELNESAEADDAAAAASSAAPASEEMLEDMLEDAFEDVFDDTPKDANK